MVNTATRRTSGRGRGFTMIELLVVIVILMLLVGILLPAFGHIMKQAKASKVAARIQELCNGCDAYRMDTGFFPGQMYPTMMAGSGGSYTGSQILALCLFTNLSLSSTALAFPTSAYCSVNVSANLVDKSDLFNPVNTTSYLYLSNSALSLSPTTTYSGWRNPGTGAAVSPPFTGRPFTISDRFAGRLLPVLYYPSRLGRTGFAQYFSADNSAYTLPGGPARSGTTPQGGTDFPNPPNTNGFTSWITDSRFGSVVNPDRYLMAAAGVDGIYGTGDDLKNW